VQESWPSEADAQVSKFVMPMQNLSRRGLHGTALEYAKLLLGLDPSDPRGVLFCIDYLAIRAHQYKFLRVRLCLKLSMVHAFFLSFSITLSTCCAGNMTLLW